MPFPSTLSTFNRPTTTDRLNSPSHSALHNTVSSALGQVEAVIGVDGISSVVGTMMYDLRSPASGGGGHVQVANKGGTGQTTFTKGDILVAQSSSVLTKLAVGGDGAFLKANSSVASGIQWGTSVSAPTVRVYGYSSSVITWNKPSVLSYILVEVQGGGGGGGGADSAPTTNSGGGAGGYSRKVILASVLGLTEPIVVGAGGAGGAGSGATADNGVAGGTTGFGTSSILYATGGGVNGGGGSGFNGDLNLPGQSNFAAATYGTTRIGGRGGQSNVGGQGGAPGQIDASSAGGSAGGTGGLYGAGGGGAARGSTGDADGGAGSDGIVIVTEY